MESLELFKQAVVSIVELTEKINEEINAEILDKAPVIIHQRLCAELVRIMKENGVKNPNEIPEAVEVMTAIGLLQRLYPKLNMS